MCQPVFIDFIFVFSFLFFFLHPWPSEDFVKIEVAPDMKKVPLSWCRLHNDYIMTFFKMLTFRDPLHETQHQIHHLFFLSQNSSRDSAIRDNLYTHAGPWPIAINHWSASKSYSCMSFVFCHLLTTDVLTWQASGFTHCKEDHSVTSWPEVLPCSRRFWSYCKTFGVACCFHFSFKRTKGRERDRIAD